MKKKKRKKKIKLIRLFLPATIVFLVLLLLIQLPGQKESAVSTGRSEVIKSDNRIEVSGIEINDFRPNSSTELTSETYVTINKTKDYHVFYLPADELFYISIASYPFDEIRPIAEQELLKSLGIDQSDACKLNVDIATPAHANPTYAGEIYGLSFCDES